jgi:uncharacterized protein YbbC (DUF1343 family)
MIIRPVHIFLLVLLGVLPLPGADKAPKVINGIDVLRESNFRSLAGKRIGLITNHTGLSADGMTTIDLFQQSEVCKLVAIFSPEHGIRGILDSKVGSSLDESTGIPIYSLYGDSRRPTAEMLQKIDVLVVDLQDIGARFYTYATTMAYCMEEAAKYKIPFFVLDRPNPIGGLRVEGPMLDSDKTSFVGYMPLPIRHGMTMGELARYFNREKGLNVQLHVIGMKDWRRSYYFWDTGQFWVNPSPNMRSMTAAILYPGVCLLEGTNVSVGRGTDKPFEMVGAPWIEPRRLAASLQSLQISGIRWVPVSFTPSTGKYQGEKCGGVSLFVTDSKKFSSVLFGLKLISVLHSLYPEEFEIEKVMELLGNADVMKRLNAGQSLTDAFLRNSPDFHNFLDKRRKALIYDLQSTHKEGRY